MKEAGDFYGQIPKIVILPVPPKFCNLKMN